jgi:hypothetical protein
LSYDNNNPGNANGYMVDMKNKRLVFCSEISANKKLNNNLIKRLVGGQ